MFPIKIKRNQIIISALVVMIAVAGYLNYIDTSSNRGGSELAMTDGGEISALIMDSVSDYDQNFVETSVSDGPYFDADEIGIWFSENDGQVQEPEPGEAVFVNSSSDTSYFVQAKLEREQSRSRQKQALSDLINNDNIDRDQKADCAAALLTIQERVEKESATEAMIWVRMTGTSNMNRLVK